MNKNDILKVAGSVTRRVGFNLRKYSPEICQVAGVVGIGVTVVMACKATLKLPQKTDIFKKRLEHVKTSDDETVNNGRMVTRVYAQYAWDLTKLYGPTAMLGVASLGSMCAATQILKNRNASLTAAYALTDKAFKEYRKRVAERFGEDIDKQLKFGATEETVKEKVTDEDGKTKTVKNKVNVVDSKVFGTSPYARFFDENNPYYDPSCHEYNVAFLKQIEKIFNDRLYDDAAINGVGYVFLNDIYKRLGIPVTKAGQFVGWVRYRDHEKKKEEGYVGDGYIDFGLNDIWHKKTRDFVNGYEPAILLDFNVDGNILDIIP